MANFASTDLDPSLAEAARRARTQRSGARHGNPATEEPGMSNSLYERLGVDFGIRRLVDGIVEAHLRNPAISLRCMPYGDEPGRRAELKTLLGAFFAFGVGRDRDAAVSAADYAAAIEAVTQRMQRQGVDERSRREVLAIVQGLRGEILGA